MDTGGCFPEDKAALKLITRFHLAPRLRTRGTIRALPVRLHDMIFN